jgi:hypothetical protein
MLKQDLPSLRFYDGEKVSEVVQRFDHKFERRIDTTTITSFNADVSAIDKSRMDSPIAASILLTQHEPKRYEQSNERENINQINLTHNMQEQAELYQDVI